MTLAIPMNILTPRPAKKVEPLVKASPQPSPVNGAQQAQAQSTPRPPTDSFKAVPAKTSSKPQPKASAAPQPGASSAKKGSTPTNVAADDQAARGWTGDASVVQQGSPTDCGTANLAQIRGAANGGAAPSSKEHQKEVERNASEINGSAALRDRVQINLKDGTTADEMGALLGKQGQKVVRAFQTFEADYMNGALQQGQFGLTLLDSNVLLNTRLPPEKRTGEPGALHWVTVDGIDDNGTPEDYSDDLYRVKDPLHGEYWLPEGELRLAVTKARTHTGSGGVLIVEHEPDAKTAEAREALSSHNLGHTIVLGQGNGIGSKRTSVLEPS